MQLSKWPSRIVHAVRLAAFFAWALAVANIRVAMDVLRPQTSIRPAVVAIPLDLTSDAEASRQEIKGGFEQRVKRLFR
jgi:multisubunit Na+/H+ antiporter MnhE subunit